MEQIREFASRYLTYFQFISVMDVVEIIIISIMMYYVMVFIRNTRAWALLKGVFVIMVFLVIAEILKMDTILWIARSVFSLAIIALIVVLQPELRKAHQQNDRAVMRAYGFDIKTTTETSCVAKLMQMYQVLTQGR